ncbi:MAG: alpha/beta hydrolase fold domain-containing protein, partial [Limnobacter sp.]|nr:alpha/beta hydrolase fold domain-containing protein [Limnobacter sp.]
LAPENPHPAALEDALSSFDALLNMGYPAHKIVVSGDSAGGSLALALCLKLKELNRAQPGGLCLSSPMADPNLEGNTLAILSKLDPMIRKPWLEQGGQWAELDQARPYFYPLEGSLSGLPPMQIQVGEQEILLSDSIRLAEKALQDGVEATLQVFERRWHVFHLQAASLSSAKGALEAQANFANACLAREHQTSKYSEALAA